LPDHALARQGAGRYTEGMLKKVATWAAIIFVVFYLVTQPTGAAHLIHQAVTSLHSAGQSLSKFVSSL
jgi:Na+(H+)/acetate symporter ActP